VLPSRVRSLTTAFGIERVLHSHRWLALLATGLTGVHIAFVLADNPANVSLLWPPTAPPRARAATAATVSMLLLCGLTLARRRLHTRYEIWRAVHALLAMIVVVGVALHLILLDHLVQDAAMRDLFVATAAFLALILVNRWVRRPIAAYRSAFLVQEVRTETPNVSTLVLIPARRSHPGLSFRPGQFAWIRLDSPWGPLQGHPFTIASNAHQPRRLEFTVRHAGDFTATVCVLTPGRRVFLDGPHGSFNDDHRGASSLLLIAAGVGITPMMSILRTQATRCDRRPHCLIIGARTPQDILFRQELHRLREHLDLDIVEVVSKPTPAWTGRRGHIDKYLLNEVLRQQHDLVRPHAYVCGPSAMMNGVQAALLDLGFPPAMIHTEQFGLV
jgi:predicted ferric reductase